MPTYYFTQSCLAAACANLFCKLYAAVFCEPPTKTLKKWYCFFRNNDWLQILSSWLWRGGWWEKYWNEHGLFFVQKMSVYICSMSDGCNLEKVYWRWVFLFSLHPHITILTGSSKENEFPWELFWALFFSSCIEKQRRARRDTKNSKVLLRTNKQQGSSVALCLSRLIWINVASNHCCPLIDGDRLALSDIAK